MLFKKCLLVLTVFLATKVQTGQTEAAEEYQDPNESQAAQEEPMQMADRTPETLKLPSNSSSIRENLIDNFSCTDKPYGYYADVDNGCQVFHVCVPVVYADGKTGLFRYSFICPTETYFDQAIFVCVREEDLTVQCQEAPQNYHLNDNFGQKMMDEDDLGNSEAPTMDGDNSVDESEQDVVTQTTPSPRRRTTVPSRTVQRRRPKIDPEESGSPEEYQWKWNISTETKKK